MSMSKIVSRITDNGHVFELELSACVSFSRSTPCLYVSKMCIIMLIASMTFT